MTMQPAIATLLALAAIVACARLLLAHRRDPGRTRRWRLLVLLAVQPLLAAALYLVLDPPAQPVSPGVLTVLTGGAGPGDAVPPDGGVVLALPEAEAGDGVERVPDLATVLRRHPGTTRVRVLGAGLSPRDRDAARTVGIEFQPPSPPRGLVRLSPPSRVVSGAGFAVPGQVAGIAGGRVELVDPARRRIDAAEPAEDGGFTLHGVALAAGAATFELRVRDAEGVEIERAPLPLWIEDAVPPRVLLLAGAPNPETRALRRWLEDAGAQAGAGIALGGGLRLGIAAPSQAALAEADLLLVDARAWSGLGDGGRARVLEAVRGGLGLLLRADAPMPASALDGLRAPGFAIADGGGTQAWRWPAPRLDDDDALRARLGAGSRDAPYDAEQAAAEVPALARRAWRVEGTQAVPLAPDDGDPTGWWRAEGQGRIALWTLLDTYVLAQHGRADLHGELWRDAIALLARARADALPAIDAGARVGERAVACGLPDGATVAFPDGRQARLLVDPATAARRCAGFWPQLAGWHRLQAGDAVLPFHVGEAADTPLRLAELREATLRLAANPPPPSADSGGSAPAVPGRAWPWFLAWLLLAALAWWFERSRLGLAGAAPGR